MTPSAATYGIGWSIKQVTVQQFTPDGGIAYCLDTEGTVVEVRTVLQRTGLTPRVGQIWLIDRTLGTWTFMALASTAGASGPVSGRAVLVAGTAVVDSSAVTEASDIDLTSQIDGGTPGWLRISSRTAGTSFTIKSSSSTDTSTVAWRISNAS